MIEGLDKVFTRFQIKPNDVSLYEQAFTHASYTNEHKECPCYDRLEFLGDSLLDMIVGNLVFQTYPDANSGELSKMRSALVEGKTLTRLSEEEYHFSDLVRYSVGEKKNTKFHKHIDEDIFESFLAAVYLDQGYDFVRNLICSIFTPLLDDAKDLSIKRNSKGRLQESLKGAVIEYVVVKKENLNSADVSFTVEARYGGEVLGIGVGHNTKEAEDNAAYDALKKEVGTSYGSH